MTWNRIKKDMACLLLYGLGFALLVWVMLRPFEQTDRYLIFGADAFTQQFPAFCYVREYWLQVLDMLKQGDFRIPLYDFSLGLGGDIWTTLHYYGLTDPFYLLGMLVPDYKLHHMYGYLIVLRFFLGGACFYGFCRKMENRCWPSLAGALIYSCCGFWGLGTVHGIMAHAIFYLPLLLWGAEKTMRKECPWLLALSTFFMALTGYYFLAICSFVLAFYVLLRSWDMAGDKGCSYWKKLAENIFRSVSAYMAGLLMSMVILYPNLKAYFASNRTGGGQMPEAFYSLEYLKDWFGGLFVVSNWGMVALGFFCLVLLLAKKGGFTLKAAAGILAVFVVSPFADAMLIGFGGSRDLRFWFAVSFVFAYFAVKMLPEIFALSRRQAAVLACSGLLTVAFLLMRKNGAYTVAAVFAAATAAVILLGWYGRKNMPEKKTLVKTASVLLAAVVLLNQTWLNSLRFENTVEQYRTGRFAKTMPMVFGGGIEDARFDVSDVAGHNWWASPNTPLLGYYNGLSEYFSIMDADYCRTMLDDWALIAAQQSTYSFQGLDGSAALNTLSAVRYSIVRDGEEGYVPYGYEWIKTEPQGAQFTMVPDSGENIHWYENQLALPMGYAYDRYITFEEYGRLNGLQKQAAMMHVLVTDTPPAGCLHAEEGSFGQSAVKQLEIRDLTREGNLDWENGIFRENRGEDAALSFTVDMPANSEVYVCFKDLKTLNEGFDIQSLSMEGGYLRKIYISGASDGPEGWVNLGYTEEGGEKKVRLEVSPGTHMELESLEVWAYDMADYRKAAEERGTTVLENVNMNTANCLEGTLHAEQDVALCLPVVYDEGWRVTVDGQLVAHSRANSMFMQVGVPAGDHAVRLYYVTPGLKTGALITVAGGVLLLAQTGAWLFGRKKQKNTPRAEG